MRKLFFNLIIICSLNTFGQITISPDKDYYNQGRKSFQKRECLDAISSLNKAILINPNYAEAYQLRAYAKKHLGDYYGANLDLEKCIYYCSDEEILNNVYATKANIKRLQGNLEGAIADYTKCIEINPADWVSIKERGLLKIKNRQLESGCLDLSRVGEMGISLAYDLIKKHCN